MVDQATINLVVFSALLIAIAGLGFWYTLRRLRTRRDQLRRELSMSPGVLEDRAFNAISRARVEASVLQREGYDVSRELERLADAQKRADRRDPSDAVNIADSVHNTLVEIRRTGKVPTATRLPASPATTSTSRPPPRAASQSLTAAALMFKPDRLASSTERAGGVMEESAGEGSGSRIAKNRVESQFEIELLDDEISRSPEVTSGRSDATQSLAHSRQAFANSDFTEALRLALKGRRQLGSKVEGLAPPPRVPGVTTATGKSMVESSMPGENCSFCGRPLQADDKFCRACGRPRESGICARCGAPLQPNDAFCGQCGAVNE